MKLILFFLLCLGGMAVNAQVQVQVKRLSDVEELKLAVKPLELSEEQQDLFRKMLADFSQKEHQIRQKYHQSDSFVYKIAYLKEERADAVKKLLTPAQYQAYTRYQERKYQESAKERFQIQLNILKRHISPALSDEQEKKINELLQKNDQLAEEIREKYKMKPHTSDYYRTKTYEEVVIGGLPSILTKEQWAYYETQSVGVKASRLKRLESYKEKMKSE